MTINPGNTRTITLTEAQVWDVLDAIDDRIEQLEEASAAVDLHTNEELLYFREEADRLRVIRTIMNESE